MTLLNETQLDANAVWKIIRETKRKVFFEELIFDCPNDGEHGMSDTHIKDIMDIFEKKIKTSESMTSSIKTDLGKSPRKSSAES